MDGTGSAAGLAGKAPRNYFSALASQDQPWLSHAETFLWWSARLAGDSTFNVRVVLRLRGPIDVSALSDSVVELGRRHEALRTAFPREQRIIVRRVLAPESIRPVLVDLTDADSSRAAEDAIGAEANRGFNLSSEPLCRVRILRLGDREHVLQFTIHHLIIDRRSVDVLLGDLAAIYKAFREGKDSPLPDLPVGYGEYVVGRKREVQERELDKAVRHWQTHLAQLPSLIDLPTDTTRRPARYFEGRTLKFDVSIARTTALSELARRHGVTVFVVLLAALKTLLHRLSGQTAVAVEIPISSRRSKAAQSMVGLLVDLAVLRTDFTGEPRFDEVLSQVRAATLGALEHAVAPLHVLVDALGAEVDESHSALSQVMFNLIDRGPRADVLRSLGAEPVRLNNAPHSKFDLMVTAYWENQSLSFEMLYKRDLFSDDRMQHFAGQFSGLLDQVVDDPATLVGDYSIAGTSITDRTPRPPLPGSGSDETQSALLARIRTHAHTQPTGAAIVLGDRETSYGALALRADAVSGTLDDHVSRVIDFSSLASGSDQEWAADAQWTASTFSLQTGRRIGCLPGSGAHVIRQAIYAALWSGGTVHLPAPGHPGQVSSQAIELDVIYGELAAWRRFALPEHRLSMTHGVVVGGVMVATDVKRLRAFAPRASWAYLPFGGDDSGLRSCYLVAEAETPRTILPIGRGMSGTELAVLDRRQREAGVGELGELYFRGAHGSSSRDRTWTPTGLAARYLPGGEIDRLGDRAQRDTVRGYTVRFDEVISALMEHPAVLDARVFLDPDDRDSLAAQVSMIAGHEWPGDDLAEFLRVRLAPFMIPKRYIRAGETGAGR
jgi:non-ribosomal peptide synthetase component F